MKNCLSFIIVLFFCIVHVQSQDFVISGKVIDGANGHPLEYATIIFTSSESNETIGSLTDNKGHFKVEISKSRHPLCDKLKEMDLPSDEIYTNMEQTKTSSILMQTTIYEGTFPQCYECETDFGGKIIGFLPGHRSEVTTRENFIYNICLLIDYLL